MQDLVSQQGLARQGVAGEQGQQQVAPPGQVQHQNGGDAADDDDIEGNEPQRSQGAGLEGAGAQILLHGIANSAGIIGAELAAVSG